jgi:hypothetical protein
MTGFVIIEHQSEIIKSLGVAGAGFAPALSALSI